MHRFNVTKSTSTATTSTTNVTISEVSQPESAARKRLQGSFMDLLTTAHTLESTPIRVADQQFVELRLLSEIGTAQTDPFETLVTHQTVTFDDEVVTTEIAGAPDLPSDQYQAEQSPEPTDKSILVDKSQEKPYKSGYPGGCDKRKSKFKCPHPGCFGNEYFRTKVTLKRHIVTHHTSKKPFQCDSCNRRFGRKDCFKDHRKRVHGIEDEKKSPKRKRK